MGVLFIEFRGRHRQDRKVLYLVVCNGIGNTFWVQLKVDVLVQPHLPYAFNIAGPGSESESVQDMYYLLVIVKPLIFVDRRIGISPGNQCRGKQSQRQRD